MLQISHAELTPIRLRSVTHPTLSLRTGSSRPVSLSPKSSFPLCTKRHFTSPKRIGTGSMSSRKAACEPCRKSKLACDHGRPACSRCTCQGRAGSCTYRASPFKRRQPIDNESPERQRNTPHRSRRPTQLTATPRRGHPYPNPGYLGRSSHVAIFDQLFSEIDCNRGGGVASSYNPSPSSGRCLAIDESMQAKQGADYLKQLLGNCDLHDMRSLVLFWIAKGANLALAGPFVELCAESASCTSLSSFEGEDWHVGLAQRLIDNTARPLEYDATTSFASYSAQLLQSQTRWETLSLFLCAVLRATMDVPFFPSLFTTAIERREFQAMLMRQIGCFLDVCISMDCLNDLQLFLQYEYFIIHSYMDGDQSYHLWRGLGDVISSISALGYHEQLDAKPDTPKFLIQLRKTAFARVYSADKNLALFLGRPLRMSKRFYHFHLPDTRPFALLEMPLMDDDLDPHEWHPDSAIDYRSETRWSALCASIKEEIMELMFDRSRTNRSIKVSELQAVAEEQWSALPERFRIVDGNADHMITPFERDFLISFQLNHLHVMFLLRRLLLDRLSEPDGPLIDIAQRMLALVVEAILKRDELANSGTNLSWKVAHYGLPATGMILLAMSGKHVIPCLRTARAKVLRDLTILAAEVEQGTIAKAEDPDYAVLAQAAQTIQRFLDLTHSEDERLRASTEGSLPNYAEDDYTWAASLGPEIWDSEISFWQGLAEHSSPFAQYSMPPN